MPRPTEAAEHRKYDRSDLRGRVVSFALEHPGATTNNMRIMLDLPWETLRPVIRELTQERAITTQGVALRMRVWAVPTTGARKARVPRATKRNRVLKVLDQFNGYPVPLRDIVTEVGFPRSTTQRVIRELIEDGLVERIEDPGIAAGRGNESSFRRAP